MPLKNMEPRAADSRPSRLSLIADLREGPLSSEEQSPQSADLRSTMDWDEEEAAGASSAEKLKTLPRWRKLAEKASRKTLLGKKTGKDTVSIRSATSLRNESPLVQVDTRSPPKSTRYEPPTAFLGGVGVPPPRSTFPESTPQSPTKTQQSDASHSQNSSLEEAPITPHSTSEHSTTSPPTKFPTPLQLARRFGTPRLTNESAASIASSNHSKSPLTMKTESEETFVSTPKQSTPRLDPEDDPSWNATVARVKDQLREEQEKERRERKVQAKAEMRAICAAVEPERKFRWGKSALSKLMARTSAYGWQLKGDPNNYTDEEWRSIMEALNKDDTTPLRDRLFEKIGNTGVHSSAVQKFMERHQQDLKSPKSAPPIGLGIRQEDLETSWQATGTLIDKSRPSIEEETLLERQRELRAMPSLPDSLEISDTSSTCRRKSLEALTEGFGTQDFDPRMSRILSVDVKKYLEIPAKEGFEHTTDGKGKDPALTVRRISDCSTPEITARELSAIKTAAITARFEKVRDADNFERIVEEQERRMAEAKKERTETEHEIDQKSSGGVIVQPIATAVQRSIMIPKPNLSNQSLRLRFQSQIARSYDSLIPKPASSRSTLRFSVVTPERKLTAIHPALRPTVGSEPAAPVKTPTPITKSSLRKTQSAFGLASGLDRRDNAITTPISKSDPTSRKTSAKVPIPLKFARDGVVPSVPGSPPPSPNSVTSVMEIIGPITQHPAFRPLPQESATATIDFFFNASSFATRSEDAETARSSSMTVNISSTASSTDSLKCGDPGADHGGDVFGVEDTGMDEMQRHDLVPMPPVPIRNPARLRSAPSFLKPLQQNSHVQLNQPYHDSVVESLTAASCWDIDTPTRPSKRSVPASVDLSTVAARAQAVRQLSSDGSDSDDGFDSETDRPLNNLFTSREEWIRTGPSSDNPNWPRSAPSRLYTPPQISQTVVASKPPAQQQKLTLAIPRKTSANKITQQEDSPVPAPLRTSSSSFGFTPTRKSIKSLMPGTPTSKRAALTNRSVSVPNGSPTRAVSPVAMPHPSVTPNKSLTGNYTTPTRSLLRTSMTSQEHLERVRRDQERTMVTETIRLGQALNSPNLSSAASVPLPQYGFPSPRQACAKRLDTAVSNNTSNSSRSRPRLGNLFNTDPIEQYAFDRRDRKASGARTRLSAEFDSVHSMLDQMSPTVSKLSRESARSSRSDTSIERDIIRHDLGLRPLRDCEPGEPRHPKHPYEWDTVKVMCRNIHNPGTVLPRPPDIPTGRPVHMSEYADDFFQGIPHTVSPTVEPRKCRTCPSFCCHYADLLAHSEVPTTDVVAASSCRRVKEAVESLRMRKPNGMEEFETFLQCSFCQNEYCPKCIVLCKESMCQQPVCRWCKEATEFCDDHNIF